MQKNLANRSLADSKQQRKKVAGCGPRNSDIVAKESGRGQPHSRTLARGSVGPYISRVSRRSVRLRASVLECGCPLPLSSERSICRNRSLADSNLFPLRFGLRPSGFDFTRFEKECAIARQRLGVRLSSAA